MGVGISGWELVRAVSKQGQLGVLSGTAIDVVASRILQLGDQDGHFRRALAQFPDEAMAGRVLATHYVEGGIGPAAPFRTLLQFSLEASRESIELTICANFAQVWLAKQGHAHPVGVNYLEKMQVSFLHSLYGALLGGVDYVLVGAGVPNQVPAILHKLVHHERVSYHLDIAGGDSSDEKVYSHFDPSDFFPTGRAPLALPRFFPIIASASLAQALMRSGTIDGFVVEGPTAGGHNAPPRGQLHLTDAGEPVYGPKDEVDFDRLRKLGTPFWLAGSYASPEGLQKAMALGAQGIQVGSIFALCEESQLRDDLKHAIRSAGFRGEQRVFTDPRGSPTGFPFKIAILPETLTDHDLYISRTRVCDVRGLRRLYRTPEGTLGYRCPAELVVSYVKKGGDVAATTERKCLCNALLANISLGQRRAHGESELPLVTMGDDLSFLRDLMADESSSYTAEDALRYLLS